jgi:hypothetical protein
MVVGVAGLDYGHIHLISLLFLPSLWSREDLHSYDGLGIMHGRSGVLGQIGSSPMRWPLIDWENYPIGFHYLKRL